MTNHLKKTLTSLSLLIIIASAVGCKGDKDDKSATVKGGKPNILLAEGFVAIPQVFKNEISASGSLLPNEEIEIRSEISGRVTAILFKEGSKVRAGQTLIELYNAEIAAQIKKLKAQRDLQIKMQERQKQLVEIGGISKQEYETTQTQVEAINADIAFAEAQMRSTRILAPFDGTIGIRNISVGAVVSPTTVITTLQQISHLKMDFTVPDQYYNALSAGKDVFFSVTGIRDTLVGKIAAIDPGATSATRTVRVRATIPNADNKLVAGSFAQVFISIESNKDAILIPSQSVIPTSRDKQVAVVKDGKVNMVTVLLGSRTSDKVEVTNGLMPGDTIITTGLMQLKPGMDVKITKIVI
jgi:membrane fusion protein, multidrug efflux system